jgi:arabinose-5-phosphate isomerase
MDSSMSKDAMELQSAFAQLRAAREILTVEAETLHGLAERLDTDFCRAVELIHHCRGSLIVTGMGKAGLIGQKIAATLASTGTRSHFLHPAEAIHGDLGRICHDDVLLILSQSGETEEITRLLPSLADLGVAIVAVTGRRTNRLGQAATVTVPIGTVREAGPLGLAPSASTTAMLALGDAFALVVSRMRGFRADDFARFHPGGSLGRKLSKVDDHLRPLTDCRLARETDCVRQVIVHCTRPGRRTGAIMLTSAAGQLVGIFTDSDLARLFEHRRDRALDGPIADVMTRDPLRVTGGTMMVAAVHMMAERKISELPVVDSQGRPIGLIDVTDVVGLFPQEVAATEQSRKRA